MADKIFHSTAVTFVDMTDSRTLDVYISSNHPTVQIYDSNTTTSKYTPDWSVTNLELKSSFYLDSQSITPAIIKWYAKIGATKNELTSFKNKDTLVIDTNALSSNPIITYICEATYDAITAFKEITFTRVDTGKNGSDGTSVNIKGTATSVSPVSGTDYYTVVYSGSSLTLAEEGDAYVYNGDLYVCVGVQAENGTDYFINVGRIQGPAGQDAKSIILSGDSQVFKINTSNVATPATIKVTAQAFNTTVNTWTYSTNGGQSFVSSVPAGVSRNGNVVTITGASLTSNSLVVKASDGSVDDIFTVYKAFDGAAGTPGTPGTSASMAFLTNENVTFSANASGQITATSITTNVVSYNGSTKVTPAIGTIANLPTGMTVTTGTVVNNEIPIVFTIASNATLGSTSSNNGSITIPVTSPVNTNLILSWSKVNAGPQGTQGNRGNDAYTVLLTNESHVFAGDVSNAVDGSTTTQVLAYNGSAAQTVTISSVNGKAAAITDTDTGIAGLKFKCSALSGTSPTITFTCTDDFVSPSGIIPIVLSVGGVSFTKMFTYSIAFKGATGGTGSQGPQGPAGQQGTSASLVNVTPSALYFKSTTGKDGTFTPEYIYLYPRFQTVTYGKWEYSTDGGVNWNTVYTNNNGLTIGTYSSIANTLSIARTSNLYTDTVTSISFRCVSSNASVYDTVSIAKIYDVVDLEIGGRNLLLGSGKPLIMQSNNATTAPITNVFITEGTRTFIRVKRTNLESNPTTMSLYNSIPLHMLTDEIRGKTVTMSFAARASKDIDFTIMAAGYNPSGYLTGHSNNISIETEWKRFSLTTVIPENIDTGIRFCPFVSNNISDLEAFYLDVCEWKIEFGNKSTDWTPAPEDLISTTFQIYAPDGYVLSNKLETLTLQTFAYEGSSTITSATYVWSYQENDEWVTISGATTGSLSITKDDVIKTKTYRCAMTYKGITHYSTATVQDITDVYDVMICVSDNINPLTGIYYWVVYALLYSEQGEADALLGPISIDAPESPVSGDYWYSIDGNSQKVTLKKYNGSAWVASTDKQTYTYDWRQIINGTQHQAIGNTDKVQIISCNSFTSNATFQCIVADTDGSKLARCNIHLTDTSDPIVSATAPVGVKDGQLWMQTQTDGTFLLYIWDADTSTWKQLNADTKNVVHTAKPSSYKAGDLWVVESDTAISGYTKGTLLQSNATTTTFAAAHWTPSLKYESELADVQKALKAYKQYMSVDSDGLHMQAKNADGTLSPFQALFTNTRLSFYQDDLEVAYISDNKLNIYEANIDVLSVEKKIQLQKFEWAIESNGSMSLIVNY